jgi:hypothetical protein
MSVSFSFILHCRIRCSNNFLQFEVATIQDTTMVKALDFDSSILVTESWQAAKQIHSFDEKLGVLLLTK